MIEIDLNKDKLIIPAMNIEDAEKIAKKLNLCRNTILIMPTEDFIIVRNCK